MFIFMKRKYFFSLHDILNLFQMNPFAGYRYINVEDIIRANIRPNNVCMIEY
jgi:hypothetical protein